MLLVILRMVLNINILTVTYDFDISDIIAAVAIIISVATMYNQFKQHKKTINSNLYKEIILNNVVVNEIPLKCDLVLNLTINANVGKAELHNLRKLFKRYKRDITLYKFYLPELYWEISEIIMVIDDICSNIIRSIINNDTVKFDKNKDLLHTKLEEFYRVLGANYI